MGEQFIEYISTNTIELIIGTIFCLLGVLLSILSGGKKIESKISNKTSVIEMKSIVQNNYQVTNNYHSNKTSNVRSNSKSDSEEDMVGILGVSFIAAILYAKHHSIIMTILLLFSVMTLVFLTIIGVLLSRNEQLDHLNKHWIITGLSVIFYNFISLFIMYNQNINIVEGIDGISAITRIFTYLIGFVIQIGPNIMLLLILVYLFSLNLFLIKPNIINKFFVKKLLWLTRSHKFVTSTIAGVLCFSLLLSTGLIYKIIEIVSGINKI